MTGWWFAVLMGIWTAYLLYSFGGLVNLMAMARLFRGYCPRCNSSPPVRECPVCQGSYDYGPTRATSLFKQGLFTRWMKADKPFEANGMSEINENKNRRR